MLSGWIELETHALGTRMNKATKTIQISTLASALLLATVGMASAGSDDDPFAKPRTNVGFGMLVGGYSVGPVEGAGVGLHLNLGRQMGPLYLYGEYNMLSIGESSYENEDPIKGMTHRFGLNARYNFAEFGGGRRTPVQGSFWLEGGVGRQNILWDEGGKLTRDDVGLGFGIQTNFRLNRRYSQKKPKILGFYYACRAIVARSPTADQMEPVTCGGPCDEPTAPSPYDLGLFFNMGLNWGR